MNDLKMYRILQTCHYPELRDALSIQIRALFLKYLEYEERAEYMRRQAPARETMIQSENQQTILRFRRLTR